jgi:dienelactone hydrolase
MAAEPISESLPISVEIGGRSFRLDGVMVRPNGNGRYPLALLNHGSCGRDCRRRRSPDMLRFQADMFAGWGYAAYILMRRDNGASDGPYAEGFGGCKLQNYDQAARSSANDMVAAIRVLAKLDYIDPARIVAVGQSGGGIGVIALTAKSVPGVVAAVNFAGGRGSSCLERASFDNSKMIAAWRSFGQRSRVPTLWIYTENDENWGVDLPRSWHRAFIEAGGKADYVLLPPFGRRGHAFFYREGAIPIWKPFVETFLQRTVQPRPY